MLRNTFKHDGKISCKICKISYKFVKNESYKIFKNICEPNLIHFTSIHKKGSK
jgi:uncharacterized Zn finger protein (UPF0148 family)